MKTPASERKPENAKRRLTDLEFFASAVAARPLQVIQSHKREPSYCDGACIYIDPTLSTAQVTEVILVHAALLASGSLHTKYLKALRGRPGAAKRYLALELPRIVKEQREWLPHGPLCRIPIPDNLSESSTASLQQALDKRYKVEEPAEYLGTIRPFRVVKNLGGSQHRGKPDGKMGAEWQEQQQHDDNQELDASGEKVIKLFSAPLFGSHTLSNLLRNLMGAGRSPGNDDTEDDGSSGGSLSNQVMMSWAAAETVESALKTRQQLPAMPLVSEPSQWSYPEWNTFKNSYRDKWVNVSEIESWPPEREKIQEHCDISPAVINSQLLKVGVEYEIHNGQPSGDDLDLDELVDYATELAVHHTPHENVYRASQRTKRDLSVLILLDASQSTKDRIDEKTSIINQHREAARQIASAFSLFGDRVAVYGFHSWGRKLMRFLKVKAFNEPMNSRVHQRLNWIEGAGLSRIGAAIRHATQLLQKEQYNTHRLVLLLSDGYAYDDEYEGKYSEADTLKSLEEARQQGIACVCVNIGTSKDDDALKRIYGESTYFRAKHASELPGRLRRMLNTAIYQASHPSNMRKP